MKTGQVQIFGNQSATFNHPNDYSLKFRLKAFEFTYAPEWILESEMYKALKKDGKIKLIKSSADVADIETKGKVDNKNINDALNSTNETQSKENKVNLTDNELKEYSEKTARELYDICAEKGIEVESKKAKEYYLEKLIG